MPRNFLVPEYREQATEEQVLGLITAHMLRWDGIGIMKAAAYALEDANFHKEAAMIKALQVSAFKRAIYSDHQHDVWKQKQR